MAIDIPAYHPSCKTYPVMQSEDDDQLAHMFCKCGRKAKPYKRARCGKVKPDWVDVRPDEAVPICPVCWDFFTDQACWCDGMRL